MDKEYQVISMFLLTIIQIDNFRGHLNKLSVLPFMTLWLVIIVVTQSNVINHIVIL